MDISDQNFEEKTMQGKFIPMTSIASGMFQEVAEGVFFATIQIANIVFIKTKNSFVLIDAGMPGSADEIIKICEKQFGQGVKPEAIILTHGHFDHIGALEDLRGIWDVPIYAHLLELPYLTGQKNYPKPDGTVEGGLIAKISPLFPNEGIDLQEQVQPLPDGGNVPYLPDWRWIHTPGHTDGHISLYREKDRTLIVGDAFVTVRQDAFYKVLMQKQEVNGPPRYFTTDWLSAWNSVKKLAALNPEIAITGHGLPMEDEDLRSGLKNLVEHFDSLAIPDYGKYLN